MKLLYGAVSLLLAPLYLLTACWSAPQDSRGEIARQTGLDLSGGEEISCYDTHSGNGDGVSCIVWQFPDDQVLEQVEQDARWEALPLDETEQTLAYGISGDWGSMGPYLTDEEGKALLPQVKEGYSLLLDRHQEAEEGEDRAQILKRYSLNLTLALYDSGANTLYFCELDT